jgi:hypothetical protein
MAEESGGWMGDDKKGRRLTGTRGVFVQMGPVSGGLTDERSSHIEFSAAHTLNL